jgi:ribose/xylose/arabinose/galactoside ABC-type transport system permease subunit
MSTVQAPPAPAAPRRSAGLVVQFGWEGLLLALLMATAGLVLALTRAEFNAFLMWQVASLGLLAAGFALSLRTATPNLAVGAFAVLAGLIYARLWNGGWTAALAAIVAVSIVLGAGLLLGALTGLLSAPGWAMSLVGLAAGQAAVVAFAGDQGFPLNGAPPTTTAAVVWLVAFVVVSVTEGVLFLVPAVRRFLGANRTGANPTEWRPARIVGAVIGLGGSSLLAGLSGVALVEASRFAAPGVDGSRLLLAVGVALLGGVGLYGRRGGAVGTVFATGIVTLSTMALAVTNSPRWLWLAVAGAAIAIGIGYSRVLEAYTGPE